MRRIESLTKALLVASAILAATASARAADDTVWTMTCTAGGKVVMVEKVPESRVAARSLEFTNSRPDATCVYLGAGADVPDLPEAVDGVTPMSPDIAVPGAPLSTGNNSLDTALRALRGEHVTTVRPPKAAPREAKVDPNAKPGPVYEAPPEPVPAADPAGLRPEGGDWVRLGLYRGIDKMDAIADWVRIVKADPLVFAGLTPDVVETKDYVMLTAGPVTPSERVDLCMSAATLSIDCMFGTEESLDENSVSMRDFLAASGGDVEPLNRRRDPAEIDAMAACDSPELAVGGRQCWRSGFALDRSRAVGIDEVTEGPDQGAVVSPVVAKSPPAKARPRHVAKRAKPAS